MEASQGSFHYYNYGENYKLPAWGLIIFGVALLAVAYRNKRNDPIQTIICPKDATPTELRHAPDMKCPKCGTTMEPLEGFYDRHPEFREQD